MAPSRTDISFALAKAAASISLPTGMSRTVMTPEISPLVRTFSMKMASDQPDSVLAVSAGSFVKRRTDEEIAEQQNRLEWLMWLNSGEPGKDEVDDILYPLEMHSRRLIHTWKALPPKLSAAGGQAANVSYDNVPTIETLVNAIRQAEKRQADKKQGWFGQVKDRFFKVVELMDDHKFLFQIIPKGDKYVSLFTGVIATVVKASLEYRKISEGFADALLNMSNDLDHVKRSAKISDSPEMRRLVVKLYTAIIGMLWGYLEWFNQGSLKRARDCLNKNFYPKNVAPLIEEIRQAIRNIEREAMLVAQARIDDLHRCFSGILDDALRQQEIGRQSRADDVARSQEKFSRMGETLGSSSVRTLGSVEQRAAYEHNQRAISHNAHIDNSTNTPTVLPNPTLRHEPKAEQVIQSGVLDDDQSLDLEDMEEPCMNRSDLVPHIHGLLSRYLEDGRTDITRNTMDELSSRLPSEVITGLQTWLSDVKSSTVWVKGHPVSPFGSGLSAAALRVCDVSKDIGVPCISFICKKWYSFATPSSATVSNKGSSRLDVREAGLIALLYSVIAQLIYLLPDEPFPTSPVFEKDNFERLDGTMASAAAALEIIMELATHAPPSLIWVFDNVHLVESTSTMPHLKTFAEFLQKQEAKSNAPVDSQEGGRKTFSKVCFTTDGNCMLLSRLYRENKEWRLVDASRIAQRRPGRLLAGGADVGQLGWSKR